MKSINEPQKPSFLAGAVSDSILSVANGWGEASTFYRVGDYYEKVVIAKIQQETKILGNGYYKDLTINCYVGYSDDGKKLFEINDGVNVEVRYCPQQGNKHSKRSQIELD